MGKPITTGALKNENALLLMTHVELLLLVYPTKLDSEMVAKSYPPRNERASNDTLLTWCSLALLCVLDFVEQ